MELPVPPWFELFHTHSKQFTLILAQELGPEVKGSYEHWDHLRHLTPPGPLTHEQWWLGIKLARRAISRDLPLEDKAPSAFTVAMSDSVQRRLFLVARDAAGALQGTERADSERPAGQRK